MIDPAEKNEDNTFHPDTTERLSFKPALPAGMTLESIIDHTGEMEHLNELVMLHLERSGGFTCTSAYFSAVRPILDGLEEEIRLHYLPGMSREELQEFISLWIDTEISLLQ